MRLEPIERPRGPLMRLAYWMSRRRFGKVVSPLKVIYARSPKLARLGFHMSLYVDRGTSLDPALRLLVPAAVAEANGCGFCLDIARALAVQAHVGLEKFEALPDWETSPLFCERERAAFAWAIGVARDVRVPDALFERLRKQFDEREIVEITSLAAIESYFNRIAIPFGLESDGLCAISQKRARVAA